MILLVLILIWLVSSGGNFPNALSSERTNSWDVRIFLWVLRFKPFCSSCSSAEVKDLYDRFSTKLSGLATWNVLDSGRNLLPDLGMRIFLSYFFIWHDWQALEACRFLCSPMLFISLKMFVAENESSNRLRFAFYNKRNWSLLFSHEFIVAETSVSQ